MHRCSNCFSGKPRVPFVSNCGCSKARSYIILKKDYGLWVNSWASFFTIIRRPVSAGGQSGWMFRSLNLSAPETRRVHRTIPAVHRKCATAGVSATLLRKGNCARRCFVRLLSLGDFLDSRCWGRPKRQSIHFINR